MVKKATRTIRNTLKPVLATARQDEDELFQTLSALPPDPDDARLTLAGAVIAADGKLDAAAYSDLHSAYAGEPPPAKHPDPDRPGVRKGEEVPKGLRIWDDLRAGAKGNKDGAGWIAQSTSKGEKKKEKWFNIRTCGSWRLAFLLARLQRQLWETGGARQGELAAAAANSAAASSATATAAKAGLSPAAATEGDNATEQASADAMAVGTVDTPPRKRAAAPTAKATARKQVRRAEDQRAGKSQPATPPNPFAGSERFAAIMAARKVQEASAGGDNSAKRV